MHKKSQAAMEFLMTYGWALLVVFISISALTYFGLLNPGRYLPDKTELGAGLIVKGSTMNTTHISLIVSNGLGKELHDLQINASECTNIDAISNQILIKTGKTEKIVIPCEGSTGSTKFRSKLIVNYSTKINSNTIPHQREGLLSLSVDDTVATAVVVYDCSFFNDCSEHGTCINTNVCSCDSGWDVRTDCNAPDSGVIANEESCTTNAECQSGYCNPVMGGFMGYFCSSGLVGAACETDGTECQSGYCGFSTCTNGEIGDDCTSVEDCQSDYCGNYECTNGENGDACRYGSECLSNICADLTCADDPGVVGDTCWEQASCEEYCNTRGRLCTLGEIGNVCGANDNCDSTYCNTNAYICSTGLPGASCGRNTDCKSGNCNFPFGCT